VPVGRGDDISGDANLSRQIRGALFRGTANWYFSTGTDSPPSGCRDSVTAEGIWAKFATAAKLRVPVQ
jgi:hypothetical protein